MRVKTIIPLDSILVDRLPAVYPTSFSYAIAMNSGVEMPPIKVALREDGLYEIRDGRHRLLAAYICGKDRILARFSNVPLKLNRILT